MQQNIDNIILVAVRKAASTVHIWDEVVRHELAQSNINAVHPDHNSPIWGGGVRRG